MDSTIAYASRTDENPVNAVSGASFTSVGSTRLRDATANPTPEVSGAAMKLVKDESNYYLVADL
jgi:hypothetical protein